MAHTTTANILRLTASEQQAREIINEYLGSYITHLTISHVGRELWVNLAYCDFRPTRVVQRYLEDRIPNINFQSVERDYSDRQMFRGLEYAEELFPEIYVKEQDGCLRPASPLFLVLETLKHLDLTQSDADIYRQVCQQSPMQQLIPQTQQHQQQNQDQDQDAE